jgi:6-phosphogluconolactonase
MLPLPSQDVSRPEIVVLPDLAAMARAAAARVRDDAAAALARGARFRVALAGGSTPRALYHELVVTPGPIDWRRTDVFFGDERSVPPDDTASNYRMAREALLDPAAVPPANVRRMRGEAADLDQAARAYEAELTAGAGAPWLDLALLGLGADGHTASLFPATSALGEQQRLCVAVDVPQLATRRLTLTYPVFEQARGVIFLVAGRDKAEALRDVVGRGGDHALPRPAARIVRRAGPVVVFCDREAAALLAPPAPEAK